MREKRGLRKTNETNIELVLNIDGDGTTKIKTGIPFFDHLITLFSHHSMFSLDILANGDLPHHIIEDIGICLGETFNRALGDKNGIARYGYITLPMDEALILVSLDISGRPGLFIKKEGLPFKFSSIVDGLDTSIIEGFLKAFVDNAKITLHIIILYGDDLHHIIEGIFKGLGRALRIATRIEREGIPSSKGLI